MSNFDSIKDKLIAGLEKENQYLQEVIDKQNVLIETLKQENSVLLEYTDNLREMVEILKGGET